ncbi:uncharacterized protein LAESUDRAFT_716511 [Laetiporus sulphureus 93-53]|uniref:Uncharacterized protein n=1 Tax=Laetiporus sulphureus 93-53 TaxID=1314785 RepID=A0A165CJG8_9APHY|nr:uncharacterized protein LAESUDRAFT_716511 [Laetiporus sulphureus 93-53]KZT02922.1 hypothetical protein LAESUDRAFT_716511 [Laetiporus sulphureus 93-53]
MSETSALVPYRKKGRTKRTMQRVRNVFPQCKEYSSHTKVYSAIEWIHCLHGTCPIWRYHFASIRQVSESDNESSDGDYMPGENEDDEDDEDDFKASEMDVSLMDTGDDEIDILADTGVDDAEGAHTAANSRTRSEEVPISQLVCRNVTDFVDGDLRSSSPPAHAEMVPRAYQIARFSLSKTPVSNADRFMVMPVMFSPTCKGLADASTVVTYDASLRSGCEFLGHSGRQSGT